MRALVLGGYGLIGNHIIQHLTDTGHDVVGLGRNTERAVRRFPNVHWVTIDLATLTTPDAWRPILREAAPEAIINCAGIMQNGLHDKVGAVQSSAMRALYAAAATDPGISRFIQISAPNANPAADTAFMRSKGEADSALRNSALDWTILRPGLVLAADAYGGSALLRALAATPLIQPIAYADAPIQTVSADDIADAVARLLAGDVPTRRVYDLVEDHPHALHETVGALRIWLGHPPVPLIRIPNGVARMVSRIADGLGWLGWRPPLRSAAITELAAGVTGDPQPWRAQTGRSLASLHDTLRRLPATAQERWFARAYLLMPLVIGTLALFWLTTGLIALADPGTATEILTQRGINETFAMTAVFGGALADLTLGAAILFRKTTRSAALGMIALTLAYLAGGTLLAPDLWLDPLGALVKPIPGMALALVAAALVEQR